MKVKVFSPATVANLASGFDVLGLCLNELGDIIYVSKSAEKSVSIITDTDVPLDPTKNTAGRGLLKLIKDKNLDHGFVVEIKKNIPLCSGLGGSASSAVGAIFGANYFLETKLSKPEMLLYALEGESATGSSHYDNISPCLFGGIVGISKENQVMSITKNNFNLLLIHQDVKINTNESRKKLPKSISLKKHTAQSQNLLSLILGLQNSNETLISQGLNDLIIEPKRSKLIPNFLKIKNKLKKQVLGGSISGSGPTMFFIYNNKDKKTLEKKIIKLQNELGFSYFFDTINPIGPTLEEIK